jgi:predicted acyltransferase
MAALQQRFTALDVFRGMTICFMIIVNTPGNGATTFSPLLHAHWHGFTPTDLVFPSFLFAVGNAISFVMPKWADKTQWYVLGKIVKRTALIFLIGFLMYWFPFITQNKYHETIFAPFSHTRVFGVLQRIALSYGIAAVLAYYFKPKTLIYIALALLFSYWAILYIFGDPADPLGMLTNAGTLLDKWLLPESHLYHGEGVAFDPEGLLSTMTSVCNVIFGILVGKYLQKEGKTWEALTKLLLAGCGLVVIAYFWNLLLPINKKIWTSSFVFYTVGLDCLILSAVIYLIDFKNKTGWNHFFLVFGRNPLFIYLLSEVLVTVLYIIRINNVPLFRWLFMHVFSHAGMYVGSLLFALSYMLLCWLVGYWLDKKKIYVRV